jgi:hypothetical protein
VNVKGWAVVIGFSMTPALFAGPHLAFTAGIKFGFAPSAMIPVVAIFGFIEGLIVAWLAGTTMRIRFVDRAVERFRKPRALAFAQKWGVWGGLTLGAAVVGQEPILVALRGLGVDMRRITLPLLTGNALLSVAYYLAVRYGLFEFGDWLMKQLTF